MFKFLLFTLEGVKQMGQAGKQGLLLLKCLLSRAKPCLFAIPHSWQQNDTWGLIVIVYGILDTYILISIFLDLIWNCAWWRRRVIRSTHYIVSLKAFPMTSPGCKVHDGFFACSLYFSTFTSHYDVFKTTGRFFLMQHSQGWAKSWHSRQDLHHTRAKDWARWPSSMVLGVCPFHTL